MWADAAPSALVCAFALLAAGASIARCAYLLRRQTVEYHINVTPIGSDDTRLGEVQAPQVRRGPETGYFVEVEFTNNTRADVSLTTTFNGERPPRVVVGSGDRMTVEGAPPGEAQSRAKENDQGINVEYGHPTTLLSKGARWSLSFTRDEAPTITVQNALMGVRVVRSADRYDERMELARLSPEFVTPVVTGAHRILPR